MKIIIYHSWPPPLVKYLFSYNSMTRNPPVLIEETWISSIYYNCLTTLNWFSNNVVNVFSHVEKKTSLLFQCCLLIKIRQFVKIEKSRIPKESPTQQPYIELLGPVDSENFIRLKYQTVFFYSFKILVFT
jgi:hypothetical protein